MKYIQPISITKLIPHPKNPRRDLGDLTELTESIKAVGVLQNLTVVENGDGTYTIVIGHRRHAAAKEAGLTQLPCFVVDMTEAEQVATMLLENLQRNELTLYEQAYGFQTMLDLGESVESISEKTGFSKSTVKRRLKLTELDMEELKLASERQITLSDLEKLSEIEDPKARSEVLKSAGTSTFNGNVQLVLSKQKQKKKDEALIERFKKAGWEYQAYGKWYDHRENYEYLGYIYSEASDTVLAEKYKEGVKNYFTVSYGSVYLKRDKSASDIEASLAEESERKIREEKLQNAKNALSEAFARAYKIRYDFIKNLPVSEIKRSLAVIVRLSVIGGAFKPAGALYSVGTLAKLFGIKESGKEVELADLEEHIRKSPERALLYSTYASLGDHDGRKCFDVYAKYYKSEYLTTLYEFMRELGYIPSDEEEKLLDGTSELYFGDEEGDE